jgi:dTDP-4-dehydrorhamnose 3,5-epimerase
LIPGVERRQLEPHSDPRGTLTEIWRASVQPFTPQQLIVTSTAAGALRGMHVHLRQADLCHVVSGRAFMALIDLRTDGLTKETFWLTNGDSLLIPPGVAHGYTTSDGVVMLYLLSHEGDGTDEFGFAHADPDAAIAWPVATPTLSDRDRRAGSLRAARDLVRTRR